MSHTATATSKAQASFPGPADTTLVSADGVEFHIASSQLARASGWFRTLFTLPQGERKPEKIAVSEDSLTLEVLLHLCSGTEPGLARLTNLGDLELCLRAAEKYEMAGALEVLPLLLRKPDMQDDAVHLYALAARYVQEDVAASALQRLQTMRLDFDTIEHLDFAQLRWLVARRQERIERFCALLVQDDVDAPFYLENTSYCTRETRTDNVHYRDHPHVWTSFALSLQTAFIKSLSLDDLKSDERVQEQLETMEIMTCEFRNCNRLQYDWKDIHRRLSNGMGEG